MRHFDVTKGIVAGTEWVSRLALLNLTWLLFSLPIITLIPATNTLFYILHLWSKGETSIPIFQSFCYHFKTHFWSSYKKGLPIFIVWLILVIDQWFLGNLSNPSAWVQIYQSVLYFLTILFSMTALFYVALPKNFGASLPKQFLTSFLLMVAHPLISLGLLAMVFVLLLVFYKWPALIFFFSASGIGWAATLTVNKTLHKIKQKNNLST